MKLFRTLFTSPEKLLQVINQHEVQESIDDGERIVIDEDGNAGVNIHCTAVKEDYARHVKSLQRA